MKRSIILSILLISAFSIFAQIGTIVDNQTYIEINYPGGDTVAVGKDQVIHLKSENNLVFIVSYARWGNDNITKIVSLKPREFGYTTTSALRNYLAKVCFSSYTVNYSYNAGGSVDTVKYYIGDDLQFSIAYGYTDGNVISKTAPF